MWRASTDCIQSIKGDARGRAGRASEKRGKGREKKDKKDTQSALVVQLLSRVPSLGLAVHVLFEVLQVLLLMQLQKTTK